MLELRVNSPRIMMFEWLRMGTRLLKVVVLMLLVGVLAFGVMRAWQKLFVENLEEFALKSLPMTNFDGEATTFLNEGRLQNIAGLEIDGEKTIFQIDIADLEARLLEVPEISKVEVTRRLPDTIEIKVQERFPIAWIACPALGLKEYSRESGALVDEDGVVFRCSTDRLAEFWEDLPVVYAGQLSDHEVIYGQKISHQGLMQAVALLSGMVEVLEDHDRMAWVMVKDEITLEAKTFSGMRATFSYYDHERQLENLVRLMGHARAKGEELASVNLIPYRLVPVKYR